MGEKKMGLIVTKKCEEKETILNMRLGLFGWSGI
jgi:hypothetical protein